MIEGLPSLQDSADFFQTQSAAHWSAFRFQTRVPVQVFGAESTAVIEGLPSLQDSADFFQTQSAGPANADLVAMEQEHAAGSSQADAVAQAMDETDAAPASVPTASKATGQSV